MFLFVFIFKVYGLKKLVKSLKSFVGRELKSGRSRDGKSHLAVARVTSKRAKNNQFCRKYRIKHTCVLHFFTHFVYSF